jgi:hypothetical protein
MAPPFLGSTASISWVNHFLERSSLANCLLYLEITVISPGKIEHIYLEITVISHEKIERSSLAKYEVGNFRRRITNSARPWSKI